jgi:predicted RNA-binding Zn ribbon-like protein
MVIHAGNVALLGGELCLDFANTIDYRDTEDARELLVDYPALVLWSQHLGILTEGQARRLLQLAQQSPTEAAHALEHAIALREAICRIFTTIARGRSPDAGDLGVLNDAVSGAFAQLRVVPSAGGYAWDWADGDQPLRRILWPIARSAAELLTSDELSLVKQCAGCGWLFVDRSRNHSRRWCDMRYCGNRAKARRFYAQQRRSQA